MTATPQADRKKAKQAAQIAIVEARQAGPMKHYGLVAKGLVPQLGQHGLGQTLAYLHGRGKGRETSPYQVLANQIERHLAESLPIRSGDLQTLTSQESQIYLQATRQTHLFLSELMAFVEKFA
ncbi:MAG: type III-B CRISPR module-associated protein Cmr5 [Planctomycetota bacterium]